MINQPITSVPHLKNVQNSALAPGCYYTPSNNQEKVYLYYSSLALGANGGASQKSKKNVN